MLNVYKQNLIQDIALCHWVISQYANYGLKYVDQIGPERGHCLSTELVSFCKYNLKASVKVVGHIHFAH